MTAGRPETFRRWPFEGSPAFESPEPPVAAFDHDRLRAMAEEMLQGRRDRFTDDVGAGRVTEAEARREIEAFEYLVQNWRFIASGEGEPAGHGADHVLRDAIDEAIIRIAAFASERGGISKTLGAKAESVIALRWHLEPGRQTIALARHNHQLRAQVRAANNSREPAE